MSEIQTNPQAYEDEIDLRELFLAMWKNKYVIISITLIAAILTALFSVFALSPVYRTNLDIVISMPEQYHTRYGEYTLPISTNDQYISFITSNTVLLNTVKDMEYDPKEVALEDLRKRITIGELDAAQADKQNTFHVTVSADNPAESLKLAETLYANYIEFMDIMTKETAASYYTNYFNTELRALELSLKSNQEILKKNEELLATTPQTINQKEAMEALQEDTNSLDYIVMENIINENYTKIENDIITTKQTIYSIQDSIQSYTEYLKDIDKEKEAIAQYYETGGADNIETGLISVVETGIHMPSQPVAPTRKTSPSNARNTIIGMVIGFMVSIMVVFVREFWLKKDDGKGQTTRTQTVDSTTKDVS